MHFPMVSYGICLDKFDKFDIKLDINDIHFSSITQSQITYCIDYLPYIPQKVG